MLKKARPIWLWIVIPVILGLVLPYVAKHTLHMTTVTKILWLYMILNVAYALFIGWYTRHHGLKVWTLVVLPVLFTLATVLKLVKPQYGYTFAALYVIVSLFTFLADTRDDPDEDQFPIEQ